jgi:hypothetical protein
MVYQPKFYYKRVPVELEASPITGRMIRKETILVSPIE